MSLTVPLTTAEDLLHMPEDGFRYELISGELKKMNPAGSHHGMIVGNLTVLLGQHVRARRLGAILGAETGFLISREPDTVRAPDISFIRRDRLPKDSASTGFWPGAPDLAVEVLSPRDKVLDVDEKVLAWLRAGSRAVWVVDPILRTVTVCRSATSISLLTENDTLDGEDVVPGFRCPVAEIFSIE